MLHHCPYVLLGEIDAGDDFEVGGLELERGGGGADRGVDFIAA